MKRLSAWLAGLGVALAIGAGVGFASLLDTSSGDVQAIEQSLVPNPAPPTPAAPAPVDSPRDDLAALPEQDAAPLFESNQVTRLDSLAAAPGRSPVSLSIGSLGVVAPIERYGINQRTGQMDVPNNVREVAWYEYGPSPGEAGSAVLAAHVDLKSQGPGVFFDLERLDPGELIEVSFDDGSIQRFEVRARVTYAKDELPLDVIFSRAGAPVLTLVTCGGGFSPSQETYDSNVVVYAAPVDPDSVAPPLS